MSLRSEPGKTPLPEQLPIERDPIRWALQENNQDWYRELVEHSRDLLCVHDLRGHMLSVNPVPARLLGYSVEEMLRIPMREMIVPEYRDLFDTYLKQIERDGEAEGVDGCVEPDGGAASLGISQRSAYCADRAAGCARPCSRHHRKKKGGGAVPGIAGSGS